MKYEYIKFYLLAFVLLLFVNSTNAQRGGHALFSYVQDPVLNEEQQNYANEIIKELEGSEYRFLTVNTDLLDEETYQVSIDIPSEGLIQVYKNKSYRVTGNRLVWTAKTKRASEDVVIVANTRKGYISSTMMLNSGEWTIAPLTGNMHIIFNQKNAPAPSCNEEDVYVDVAQRPASDYSPFDPNDDRANDEKHNPESMAAECNIRIMIVFTQGAKSALADVTNTAELWIANWNTSNGNSNVDHGVELARVKVTDYVETGAAQNHPTYGNDSEDMIRLYETSDGFMDEMHGLRNQYDADMVTMIATSIHSNLAGEALPIGAVAADAFNIVIPNPGGLTLAHEHGHLYGCRHSHDNTNTPYAYGHGWHVNNNFATIMAYTNQCTPCSRIFNWANPSINGGSPSVPTGTAAFGDAARVNREVDATFSNFQTYVVDKNFFQSDTLHSEEMVDMPASNTITTIGETFIMESGSEGVFRAGTSVTLTTGFHAQTGSRFEARTEMACNALNITSEPTSNTNSLVGTSDDNLVESHKHHHGETYELSLVSHPNPFTISTTLEYSIPKDGEVSLVIYDLYGKMLQVVKNATLEAGEYKDIIDGTQLSAGTYICVLRTKEEQIITRLVVME